MVLAHTCAYKLTSRNTHVDNASRQQDNLRVVEVGFKNLETSKNPNFRVFGLCTYCVTNLLKMILNYELRFVAFTWPNLYSLDLSLLFIVLVGRNFVSCICK